MDLSRPVVVHCPSYLPNLPPMGLPMGQKLVKSGSTWARLCGTHIFETAVLNYTIWSSMELSRPVVVQHQGHLTLTLDFQGQILKMLYLKNGRANWHGTKRMWVDRMLDPHCDFELWSHPWPWPLISKVAFWKCCISRMGGPIDSVTSPMTLALDFQGQMLKMLYLRNGRADQHGTKGMWVDRMLHPHIDFELWPHPWPWPLNFKVKFWKSRNSAMGCQIDIERKGCESIGC